MKSAVFASTLAAITLILAGCSTRSASYDEASDNAYALRQPTVTQPKRHVGRSYRINGQTYYPRHQPNYRAVGRATWIGQEHNGMTTANGEIFDADNIFAAHPTLPLPSYVDVQNLANGRSLTVRVNDRGPFIKQRIISVSARAAEILGFKHNGLATVRVRYLGPAPLHHVGRHNDAPSR